MATITIFASSLSIATLLVLIKALELKFGKKNAILTLLGKMDTKAVAFISNLKFRSLQLVQSIRYIVLVQSRALFRDLVDRAQLRIVNEYQARQELIMGRRHISNKGSVSFYLKKIAEEKGSGKKGMIVEENLEI